jgi:hypothetical protein
MAQFEVILKIQLRKRATHGYRYSVSPNHSGRSVGVRVPVSYTPDMSGLPDNVRGISASVWKLRRMTSGRIKSWNLNMGLGRE